MKGTSLVVSIVLFVLIVILYVLQLTGKKPGEILSGEPAVTENKEGLRIAYIKTDSLIVNYALAEVLHDAEFQQKLQRGGFLTEQRAIQERDRLLSREQEIMKLDQDLSAKLAEMQNANNQQIIDSLLNFLKEFNLARKYDYILNAADVLIGPDSDNITAEVLTSMNARYQASQVKK